MNVNAPQFVPRIRYYIPPPVYYYPPPPPFPPVIPPVPKKDVAVQVGRPYDVILFRPMFYFVG